MALIANAKGRRKNQSPSGYTRLFGIDELGNLMSKVQGTVISSGTELEDLIWQRVHRIQDLDIFLEETKTQPKEGIWVARKKQIKQSKTISSKYEPDFLAFDTIRRNCFVIEVKDGDQFDTKKSAGEHTTLLNFSNDVARSLPFATRIYLCSFNARTRDEIFHGLKGKFSKDELLTGKEFCEVFGIDYGEIIQTRTSNQQTNLEHFVDELLKIHAVKLLIAQRLQGDTSGLRLTDTVLQ